MQLCGSLSILWRCLSLGLEWKLTFSSPVATAECSKFSDILSAALPQHHLSVFYLFAFLIFHISKSGFNSVRTKNFQMFKLVLEKAEEPEIKLSTSVGSSKKQENSRKTSTSTLLTMPKPLTVWITANCGIFWKRWEYQTTLSASWEICMQVKKQQLELDMDNRLVSNWERNTSGLYIVTLLI